MLALIISSLITVVVQFGLVNSYHGHSPDLILIGAWLLVWFNTPRRAFLWVLAAVCVMEALALATAGSWLISYFLAVGLVSLLKKRWLIEAAGWQALLALLVTSSVRITLTATLNSNFDPIVTLQASLVNLVVGAVIYHLLGWRWLWFKRWQGSQL